MVCATDSSRVELGDMESESTGHPFPLSPLSSASFMLRLVTHMAFGDNCEHCFGESTLTPYNDKVQDPTPPIETITVCTGPKMKTTETKNLGRRYCFYCKGYATFYLRISSPIDPEASLGFYAEPITEMVCEHGHSDGDLFPGRTRM